MLVLAIVDIFGFGKERKEFGIRTKRIEWLKAAGKRGELILLKYLADGRVPKTMPPSQCRKCKRSLKWGSGTYNHDHKNNDSTNNSQSNCYLVCRNCHGEATKTKVIRTRDFMGEVVGHKTIKLKVGYKKPIKKPATKPAKKKRDRVDEPFYW